VHEVSIAEAKARLSELLREVEAGEQVTITRRGKPIAVLNRPLEPLASQAEWRAKLPRLTTSSAELIRRMRDEDD
jgi:antitoxin (DNA-binding transcriptional repressor) of toxin-antitoxin stability system